MLKPSENPPIVWPEESSIVDFTGNWWVAHTKSRNEKALAWQMLRKEISYFLPMSWRAYKSKNRTIRSLLPLFTGYVFFCGDEDQRVEVLKTNRIANLIEVINPEQLLRDLEPIQKLLGEGKSLQPHDYLKAGQKCRVIAGALAGTEGIIIKTPRHTRLVLQVEILGSATSVEIDTDMIELIE